MGGDSNCCCWRRWGVCIMGGAAINSCKRLQVVLEALLEANSLNGEEDGDNAEAKVGDDDDDVEGEFANKAALKVGVAVLCCCGC